jgi:hypothetical protein
MDASEALCVRGLTDDRIVGCSDGGDMGCICGSEVLLAGVATEICLGRLL